MEKYKKGCGCPFCTKDMGKKQCSLSRKWHIWYIPMP